MEIRVRPQRDVEDLRGHVEHEGRSREIEGSPVGRERPIRKGLGLALDDVGPAEGDRDRVAAEPRILGSRRDHEGRRRGVARGHGVKRRSDAGETDGADLAARRDAQVPSHRHLAPRDDDRLRGLTSVRREVRGRRRGEAGRAGVDDHRGRALGVARQILDGARDRVQTCGAASAVAGPGEEGGTQGDEDGGDVEAQVLPKTHGGGSSAIEVRRDGRARGRAQFRPRIERSASTLEAGALPCRSRPGPWRGRLRALESSPHNEAAGLGESSRARGTPKGQARASA